MAHTASTGSAKRTVDVPGKRLGVKKFGGEHVNPGAIIIRQRGSKFYPGLNTGQGRDFTIFATKEGFVSFRRMTGYKRDQKYVDILPEFSMITTVKGEKAKADVHSAKVAANVEAKAKKASAPKKEVAPKAKKVAAKKAE